MKSYESLTKDELRDLLISNWMTHDAMWLSNMAEQFGMDATNKINKTSARMMARIEAKRIKKVLGVENPKNFAELQSFINNGFNIIRGNFMQFSFEFHEPHTIVWNVPQCFAYDGLNRIDAISQYDCGIKDRLIGWLEEMNIPYEIQPEFTGCLKYTCGACRMIFMVKF